MLKKSLMLAAILVGPLPATVARAHVLWLEPGPGAKPEAIRVYFSDAPRPGEAERVADIAQTRLWADGRPLEVERRPDRLEARLPDPPPAVVSASCDRGVVTFKGSTFLLLYTAYAQAGPIEPGSARAGDGDRLRLEWVTAGKGVRWCGPSGKAGPSPMRR